jgi:GTP-binding protein
MLASTERLPMPKDPFAIKQAEFVAAAAKDAQLPPPTTIEIAFAGRSNVGKSSLLNCLMSRKSLARTSSTPGCTRQLTFFRVTIQDDTTLLFVDLPGYGYARRSKTERLEWAELIEGYLLRRPTLSTLVLLTDVRRGLEQEERDLLQLLEDRRESVVKPLLVATKLDKLPANAQNVELSRIRASAGLPVVGFSAKTGAGRAELFRAIRKTALS